MYDKKKSEIFEHKYKNPSNYLIALYFTYISGLNLVLFCKFLQGKQKEVTFIWFDCMLKWVRGFWPQFKYTFAEQLPDLLNLRLFYYKMH